MPLLPRLMAFGMATLLLSAPVAAAPLALTLPEALSLAARHNPQLKATRQTVAQTEAGVRQTRAAYWPTLGLNSTLNQEALTSVGAGMNLTLALDSHGGLGASRRISELQRDMARWNYESAAQQLRLDLTNSYFDLQDAEQQIRIAKISLDQASTLLADAQAMQRGGEGTVFEIQRAEMRLYEAQQSEAEAKGRYLIAQRALLRQIGQPSLEGVVPRDTVLRTGEWPLSLEASISRALDRRPEIRQAKARLDLAENKRRLSLSAYGLQTQLFANASSNGLMTTGQSTISLVTDGPGLGPTYGVGGRISLNLFDGGAGRAQADQASNEADAMREELLSAQQAIQYEVEQAYVLFQIGEASTRFSESALSKAQEALSAARQRLVAGIGTQTDLILAQNDLVQAEVRRNKAIIDFNRALAALQRACFDLPMPESEKQ